MTRLRADALLVDRGLLPSREQAKAAILAGRVRADGAPVTKAGQQIPIGASLDVDPGPRYVSRGGEKLEGALADFGVVADGRRVLDVGASTGGFTDCVLQHGASAVTAVDVGYGQLAWSLRNDARVEVFERTNIRHVTAEDLGKGFGLAVVDVSFIGLDKVLPVVCGLVADDGDILALVKPQFEAGKGRVGKGGVVRDLAVHGEVLDSIVALSEESGWVVRGLAWSHLKGPKGNIEFWVWLSRHGPRTSRTSDDVVASAHAALGG
jgi:23S rRNA (cytidine1920-2'-O)/16S rRNA (cytidine1409-2'-O)-methyltransferase